MVATWLGEVVLDATLTTIDVTGVGFLAFALAEAIGYAAGTGSAVAQVVQGVLWLRGPEGTPFALAADGIASLGQRRRQMPKKSTTGQAIIVENWYQNGRLATDPYYVYIQQNIRVGKP